jgi:hypothetical protein
MGSRNGLPGRWLSLALVCGVALLVLAGCGSSSKSSSSGAAQSTAAGGSSTAAASSSSSGGGADVSSCGPTPGKTATGSPINLGTINTKQPGTDFTDQANMAQAFFTCLNANGGINGHPVKYFIQAITSWGSWGPRTSLSVRSTRPTGSRQGSMSWAPGSRPSAGRRRTARR